MSALAVDASGRAATRYYDFTVSEESTTLDVKIHLIGDVTGDGRINSRDVTKIKAHMSGNSSLWR